MKPINLIATLYSLTAVIVIVERLSPTTKIILQPYNFIRLHELIQTGILLLATIILSAFVLRIVTNNFQTLKSRSNFILLLLFLSGIYLYGAGEGWHEVASFTLNHYCDADSLVGILCQGLFINDYYTGNILFFIGGLLMNASLLTLESRRKSKRFNNNDMIILLINSLVYAFTWFAYAAFDKVLVGLFFSTLLMCISLAFLVKTRDLRSYPYTTYSATAYTLATIATIIYRFILLK